MWRDVRNTNLRRILPEHLPNDLLALAMRAHLIHAIHSAEDVANRQLVY